jgi:hypothetical protein
VPSACCPLPPRCGVRDLFSIAGAAPSLLFSPENPLVRQVRGRQHDRLESKPVRVRSRVSDIFLTHAVCRVEPGCRCAGPSPTGERRRELFPQPWRRSLPRRSSVRRDLGTRYP